MRMCQANLHVNVCLQMQDGPIALLYFYPYLYFTVFVFLNILLAVVYNSYSANMRESLAELQANRQLLGSLAYRLANDSSPDCEGMSYSRFSELLHAVWDSRARNVKSKGKREFELRMLWHQLGLQSTTDPNCRYASWTPLPHLYVGADATQRHKATQLLIVELQLRSRRVCKID